MSKKTPNVRSHVLSVRGAAAGAPAARALESAVRAIIEEVARATWGDDAWYQHVYTAVDELFHGVYGPAGPAVARASWGRTTYRFHSWSVPSSEVCATICQEFVAASLMQLCPQDRDPVGVTRSAPARGELAPGPDGTHWARLRLTLAVYDRAALRVALGRALASSVGAPFWLRTAEWRRERYELVQRTIAAHTGAWFTDGPELASRVSGYHEEGQDFFPEQRPLTDHDLQANIERILRATDAVFRYYRGLRELIEAHQAAAARSGAVDDLQSGFLAVLEHAHQGTDYQDDGPWMRDAAGLLLEALVGPVGAGVFAGLFGHLYVAHNDSSAIQDAAETLALRVAEGHFGALLPAPPSAPRLVPWVDARALALRVARPTLERRREAHALLVSAERGAQAGWELLSQRGLVPGDWGGPVSFRERSPCGYCRGNPRSGCTHCPPETDAKEGLHPPTLVGCLALASDPVGVATATAVARELVGALGAWGVACGPSVCWQVVPAPLEPEGGIVPEALRALVRSAVSDPVDTSPLRGAVAEDLACMWAWRALAERGAVAPEAFPGGQPTPDAVRSRPFSELRDPFGALVTIWQLGYALVAVGPAGCTLAAPTPELAYQAF